MRHDVIALVTFPLEPDRAREFFDPPEGTRTTFLRLEAGAVSEIAITCWRCHRTLLRLDDLLDDCPGWANDRPIARARSPREMGTE